MTSGHLPENMKWSSIHSVSIKEPKHKSQVYKHARCRIYEVEFCVCAHVCALH